MKYIIVEAVMRCRTTLLSARVIVFELLPLLLSLSRYCNNVFPYRVYGIEITIWISPPNITGSLVRESGLVVVVSHYCCVVYNNNRLCILILYIHF